MKASLTFLHCILSMIFVVTEVALAQDSGLKLVELQIESSEKLTSARAILFSDTDIQEIGETEIHPVLNNKYLVSFRISPSQINSFNFASAVSTSSTGMRYYADVAVVSEKIEALSTLSIPTCPDRLALYPATFDIGTLESLMDNRLKQRSQIKKRIAEVMNEDLATYLSKIEGVMGLNYASSLSLDLDPYELTTRLERINIALDNYKRAKSTK